MIFFFLSLSITIDTHPQKYSNPLTRLPPDRTGGEVVADPPEDPRRAGPRPADRLAGPALLPVARLLPQGGRQRDLHGLHPGRVQRQQRGHRQGRPATPRVHHGGAGLRLGRLAAPRPRDA